MKIYTVYDSKAGAYLPPVYYRSNGEAIRSFTSTVNGESGDMAKYPEDFTLFEIGEFNEQTGEITLLQAMNSLGVGVNFIAKN